VDDGEVLEVPGGDALDDGARGIMAEAITWRRTRTRAGATTGSGWRRGLARFASRSMT
jgi:hypothetical protein